MINFLPYVGPKYPQAYEGKKILVLGESHYTNGQPGWESITNDVVARFLAYHQGQGQFESWMNTFTKFAKSFKQGQMTAPEIVAFWQSIVFYNFVQEPMSGPRVAPSAQQFKNSEAAFAQVLATHQPDLVIAWGGRLWNNIPKLAHPSMMFLPHPSSSSFQYDEVYDKLKPYLQ
jgi:hypothetical protein